MAEFELKDDAANRVTDAPAPIKRTVERAEKPNPLLPALEASWSQRSKRNGSDTETGATKQYRSYSAPETLAVVRALRRGSDKLNIGVRIVAPDTLTPVEKDGQPVYLTDKDGNVRKDKDGNPIQKQKRTYRAGTIIFETHTRQQRQRKDSEDSTDAPEQEDNGAEDESEDAEDAEESVGQEDTQNEPAWS
jgi:hypothetical protein